jgi:hypothetical protein
LVALVFITAAFIALGSIAVAFIAAGFIVVQPYVVGWPWGSELLLLVLLPPEHITRHAVDIIPIRRATRTATHERVSAWHDVVSEIGNDQKVQPLTDMPSLLGFRCAGGHTKCLDYWFGPTPSRKLLR